MEAVAVTILEASRAAKIGRSKLYEEIRDGNLRAVKIGRSTRIKVDDFRQWLESRPTIVADRDTKRPDAKGSRRAAKRNVGKAAEAAE